MNVSFSQIISGGTSLYAEESVVTELSDNIFQSSIVFNPLVSEDKGNYTCTVAVESQSSNILGTAAEGVYSLLPLGLHLCKIFVSIAKYADIHVMYVVFHYLIHSYCCTCSDTLPEPVVAIILQQSLTLGTDVLLTCSITVVEGLINPPLISWVQLPDPSTTIINPLIEVDDGKTFESVLEFSPLLESHGGLCVCSARLTFPNTSLPDISGTRNYSLIVQG